MHPTLRTLRTLATAAAVTVLAATLAAPANAGEDTSMTGAPSVGDCYDLTLADVEAFDLREDAVACSEDHTAVVTDLGKLPADVVWSDKKAIIKAVAKQCPPTWEVVGDRNDQLAWYRSQYATWWLAPSKADRDAGARWFSCFITVVEDKGLADLPRPLPQLSKRLPDSVARCVTSKYEYTTCADTHAWRSSYAFFVRGNDTDKAAKAAARRVCPRHVPGRTWLYSHRDIEGPRFIVGCYAQTTR